MLCYVIVCYATLYYIIIIYYSIANVYHLMVQGSFSLTGVHYILFLQILKNVLDNVLCMPIAATQFG